MMFKCTNSILFWFKSLFFVPFLSLKCTQEILGWMNRACFWVAACTSHGHLRSERVSTVTDVDYMQALGSGDKLNISAPARNNMRRVYNVNSTSNEGNDGALHCPKDAFNSTALELIKGGLLNNTYNAEANYNQADISCDPAKYPGTSDKKNNCKCSGRHDGNEMVE